LKRRWSAGRVALQPTIDYKVSMYSYANAVRTVMVASMKQGFKAALTKVVNDYAIKLSVIRNHPGRIV
jgi:DNA gyrase subunit B